MAIPKNIDHLNSRPFCHKKPYLCRKKNMLKERLENCIRTVPNFPKEGILFKDITPILLDAPLCRDIVSTFVCRLEGRRIDAVCSVESRGFLFGMLLAQYYQVPFIPIRKKGKLPASVLSHTYNLEYGTATMEMHTGIIEKGMHVLVHDDVLATGGTAAAAAELIIQQQGSVSAFCFLVDLAFLEGTKILAEYRKPVISLLQYE